MNLFKTITEIFNREIYFSQKKYEAKTTKNSFVILALFVLMLAYAMAYFISGEGLKINFFFFTLVGLLIFILWIAFTSSGKKFLDIIRPFIERFIPSYPNRDYYNKDDPDQKT